MESVFNFEVCGGSCCEFVKELSYGGDHAFLLDADGGVPESGGPFEWINAVTVHDAVDVDVADVFFFGKFRFEFLECAVEYFVWFAPES